MSVAKSTADSSPVLLTAANAGLGALAGAIDDLQRAALILRQESPPADQRFRTPADLRRITDQFSARARSCQATHETMLAACRGHKPVLTDCISPPRQPLTSPQTEITMRIHPYVTIDRVTEAIQRSHSSSIIPGSVFNAEREARASSPTPAAMNVRRAASLACTVRKNCCS